MRLIVRFVAKLLIWLIADVKVYGLEKLPLSGACIVASNHLGRLDAVLTLTVTDRRDLILMIAEKYERVAFWRFVARLLDAFFVNRYEPDLKALREVTRRLNRGEFLVIAPEGTRSKTESLLPGKHGAVYLAQKTGAVILPVALYGTEDRVVKHNLRRLKRSKFVLRTGEPYTLPPISGRDREAYLVTQTEELMCRIAALLPEKYRGVYADHPRLHELLAAGYGQEM